MKFISLSVRAKALSYCDSVNPALKGGVTDSNWAKALSHSGFVIPALKGGVTDMLMLLKVSAGGFVSRVLVTTVFRPWLGALEFLALAMI